MSMQIRVVAAAVVAGMTLASAGAQSKKLERSALPPAVEKTVQQQSQGCTVKGIASETEDGVFQYEVEMMKDGHTRDLAVAKDGTLLEVEEQIAIDALSAPVKTALMKKAAGAKLTKVETITKKGKLVAYEAATLKGTKKGEVQVGPNGETLTHEE
jgi:hypothetical protein